MSSRPVFSSLAYKTVSTSKYSSRGGRKVEYLTIHHTAGGSNEGNVSFLAANKKPVSASYVLETTGKFVGIVPEQYRPWTTGSLAADGPAVTVETVNTTHKPDWKVSEKQIQALGALAADLSKRYGWGRLNRSRVRGHREFMSTTCPGPYLWQNMDRIIRIGNQLLDGKETAPANKSKGLFGMSKLDEHYYGTEQLFKKGVNWVRAHTKGWWWLYGSPGLIDVRVHGYCSATPDSQIFIVAANDKSGKAPRLLGRVPMSPGARSFAGSCVASLRDGEVLRLQVANNAAKSVRIYNIRVSILSED